ncbi:hypothetical protein N7447_011063 [Penicillium robsamsonii]|uniref:uncharacterized protein n=1 Tax=Penicillium robsamsonii TaxID=1792511 RepID=UPI002547E3EB|nr:uncharacterized protein N7447_011063 [Penicillium robsamsonii]KAJ5807607.1 hypothetical protein N7447_011063 [Penicillium robsamsonii]
MDFVDGVSLGEILRDPNAERATRVTREDISDDDINVIYRQVANFQLQLFKLDFDYIGSLPNPEDQGSTPARPLTFKVHCILQNGGGVGTFDYDNCPQRSYRLCCLNIYLKDRAQGFAIIIEYFQNVVGQHLEQLFGSAPWLLQDRPVNRTWDYDDTNKSPKIAARYFRYLEIFMCVLREEEAKNARASRKRTPLSDIVCRSHINKWYTVIQQ